jgi:protein TonB
MRSVATALKTTGPVRRRPVPDEGELFAELVVSTARRRRGGLSVPVSAVAHATVLAALVLVPVLWPEQAPEHVDYIRALIYNPPPPPPPPLPKGSNTARQREEPPKPVSADAKPDTEKLTAPVELPTEPKPDPGVPETDQFGSVTGSEHGVPEGMEGGSEEGVVGGVLGGVPGGVIGGTGDGPPVFDYDQAPRLLKQTKPQYPQEAFIKKIEGEVVLEIVIGVDGRVTRVRVLRSIPLLDRAAAECVRQWVFSPAIKRGRPVPTVATAPVLFRIY